jgi:hypothetical protein
VGGREGLAWGFSRVFLSKAAVARRSAVGFRSSVGRGTSVIANTGGTGTSVEVVERSFKGAEAYASLLLVTYRGIGFFMGIGFATIRLIWGFVAYTLITAAIPLLRSALIVTISLLRSTALLLLSTALLLLSTLITATAIAIATSRSQCKKCKERGNLHSGCLFALGCFGF